MDQEWCGLQDLVGQHLQGSKVPLCHHGAKENQCPLMTLGHRRNTAATVIQWALLNQEAIVTRMDLLN